MDDATLKRVEEVSAYLTQLEQLTSDELLAEFARVFPDVDVSTEESARQSLVHRALTFMQKPKTCHTHARTYAPPAPEPAELVILAEAVKWYVNFWWVLMIVAPIIYYGGKLFGFFPGTP